MQSLAHYRQKISEKGIAEIIAGRWRWYKIALQMDNWVIGRLVEIAGNTVTIDGIKLSVDNPLVSTRHKSTLYFGIYEVGEHKLSQQHIDRTLPTVEIGGSIGGIACANKSHSLKAGSARRR
jgi:hypothetical protein